MRRFSPEQVVPDGYAFEERDLREGLGDIADASVELVYAAHMLDHLDLPDAITLLQEKIMKERGSFKRALNLEK